MLDPLTCIALASSIVQFVDFSLKLISDTKELYRSGDRSSTQNGQLLAVTSDLREMCKNLIPAQPRSANAKPPSPDDVALLELSSSCKDVAQELITVLENLKAKSTHDTWESLKQAFRGALKKEKIDSIRGRLDLIQSQLQIRLSCLLR